MFPKLTILSDRIYACTCFLLSKIDFKSQIWAFFDRLEIFQFTKYIIFFEDVDFCQTYVAYLCLDNLTTYITIMCTYNFMMLV